MIARLLLVEEDEINALLADPQSVREFVATARARSSPVRRLEIETTWHALSFLLPRARSDAADGHLLGFMAEGGAPIGNIDVGYGPARAFTAAQLRRIADLFDGLSAASVLEHYDPAELGGLYPIGFWGSGGSAMPGGISIDRVFEALAGQHGIAASDLDDVKRRRGLVVDDRDLPDRRAYLAAAFDQIKAFIAGGSSAGLGLIALVS
jgi:hypothetical protein